MARPVEEPFEAMSYQEFAQGYEITDQEPTERQQLKRWKRSDCNAYIKARLKPQVVQPTPKLKADDQDLITASNKYFYMFRGVNFQIFLLQMNLVSFNSVNYE